MTCHPAKCSTEGCTGWGYLPAQLDRGLHECYHECPRERCCVRRWSCDRGYRHRCRRSDTATQGVGPAEVERQRLQYADGADFLPAVHQKPGHAAVLDDAVRPFGQLAPPVGLLVFLARHSDAPRLDRGRLAAAYPAPLAQRLGGDVRALRRRRAIDRHIGITLRQFDDVLPGHRRGIGQEPVRPPATALGNLLGQSGANPLSLRRSVGSIAMTKPLAVATCTFHAGAIAPSASRIARASGSLTDTFGSPFSASSLACVLARAACSCINSASFCCARSTRRARSSASL